MASPIVYNYCFYICEGHKFGIKLTPNCDTTLDLQVIHSPVVHIIWRTAFCRVNQNQQEPL
jgi:hypothetical protein